MTNTNGSNPYEFMLFDIHEHSRLNISDIIKKLDMKYNMNHVSHDNKLTDGSFDDKVSTDTENEDDQVKAPRKQKKAGKPNNIKILSLVLLIDNS